VDAKLQELASDPEVAPPGVLTTEPEDQVLDRRIEGRRPGRREPRTRLLSRSRCHLTRVSGPTRKLLHRSRDRTRADAARKARSAVVNRARPPPTEDLELVAEHGLLEIQLVEAAADEQAE
jgi:hypothetical protein